MKITIKATGTSPLLMHNPQMVDPEFELNRQIKAITSKRKKTDEDHTAVARLEWYGGIYLDGGKVVQPASKLRKSFIEAGRIHKVGKQIERAFAFGALNIPLAFDGPHDVDKLWESGRYVSRLSVGVMGKRVMRVRPQFSTWALVSDAELLDDVINLDDFIAIAELAGRAVGIGDNRVNGYGRFAVTVTAGGGR